MIHVNAQEEFLDFQHNRLYNLGNHDNNSLSGIRQLLQDGRRLSSLHTSRGIRAFLNLCVSIQKKRIHAVHKRKKRGNR